MRSPTGLQLESYSNPNRRSRAETKNTEFIGESRILLYVSTAQAALEAAGLKRAEWTHGGLHATFANELTRRWKLYSSFLTRDLNVAQDLRHTADYRDSDVSKRQATRALAKAREFVSQVRKGISNG